jgi:TusA-related sulfurtransferase
VEALTVEADDPQAIKNAKQIAIEILGIQARLRARNQGLRWRFRERAIVV